MREKEEEEDKERGAFLSFSKNSDQDLSKNKNFHRMVLNCKNLQNLNFRLQKKSKRCSQM